jgi:TRAP-type C4-dicarboxylate transport system permease small subunit
MRSFKAILTRLEDGLAGLLLAIVLGVVTYELTIRGLFGRSNLWTDEISRVLLIALVYIGAVGVTREGRHVRVEILLDFLSPRTRAILDRIVDALCLVFAVSATWLGIEFVRESIRFGLSFAHSNLPFPVWVAQLIVPIGFALISLRLILRLFEPVRHERSDTAEI